MEAKERLYATVEGALVREGDPRGAFLKYGIGDKVETDHVAQVRQLTEPGGVTSKMYSDDDARDLGRVMIAEPTRANRAVAAAELAGDADAPVMMHDRLATELADEARERANQDQALEQSATAAEQRVYWNEDRTVLLPEGDRDAAYLAYAPGDKIRRGHLAIYEKVVAQMEQQERREETERTVTEETTTQPGATEQQPETPAEQQPETPAGTGTGTADTGSAPRKATTAAKSTAGKANQS